jgi:hypothetical protein
VGQLSPVTLAYNFEKATSKPLSLIRREEKNKKIEPIANK